MVEEQVAVDGAELHVDGERRRPAHRARPRPRPLGRAVEPRRATRSGTTTGSFASTSAAPAARASSSAPSSRSRAGRADLGAVLDAARSSSSRSSSDTRSARRRAEVRARAPRRRRRARADRRRGRPLEPGAADARLGRADREHGARDLGRGLLVEEPAVLGAVARARHGDPRRVPRACCSRTIPATTSASAARSPEQRPLSGRLGEVGHPVLVVVGGLDDRTLPEHGRELARALPNARLVEFPDAGHSIPLEAPEETAEAIAAFLDELEAPALRRRREGPARGHDDAQLARGAVRPPRRPLGRRPARPGRR